MSEALLLYAARRDHVDRLIEPALAAGQWVISDRFADSTRAYQGAAGNLSSERIEALHELVLGGFEPDLTLILDLDPKTGMNRTLERGEAVTRFEAHEPGFHKALRDGFLAIAQSHPKRCVVIDANQSAQDVLEHAMSAVRDRIGLGDG